MPSGPLGTPRPMKAAAAPARPRVRNVRRFQFAAIVTCAPWVGAAFSSTVFPVTVADRRSARLTGPGLATVVSTLGIGVGRYPARLAATTELLLGRPPIRERPRASV